MSSASYSFRFKKIIIEHSISILFVLFVFIIITIFIEHKFKEAKRERHSIQQIVNIGNINFSDTLHRELFKETARIYYSYHPANVDSLLHFIESQRTKLFTDEAYKKGSISNELSSSEALNILVMYAKFVALYLIVMLLSYYLTNTLAVYYFVEKKRMGKGDNKYHNLILSVSKNDIDINSKMKATFMFIIKVVRNIFIGIIALFLFSPAYIIAYSMKSIFEIGNYAFMIVLGIISNGLLINYAYKFYTYLIHESRKGYVETAIVKGLSRSYEWNTKDGISIKSILKVNKKFTSHIFQHIYVNARYQYIGAMKQYTSFMITGLIIIEMALNIHGHLCYELLKNILYNRYQSALLIIFLVFLLVKASEILIDYWALRETHKYENAV